MNKEHIRTISEELMIKPPQVEATAVLLGEGATIPFIARYRKEATDSLDEVAITAIRDRLAQLAELDKRRESILKSLRERELLTEELEVKIYAARTQAILEDIYLPFRPKRRTRATVAREKGLEPLAKLLFEQDDEVDPYREAAQYIQEEQGVSTGEEALAGARDIIAEWVNEDQTARQKLRSLFFDHGVFHGKVIPGKEKEGAKYRDYYDWQEPVRSAPSHRVLAIRRGEKEGILDLKIQPKEEEATALLEGLFVKAENAASEQVRLAVQDAYKRLLSSSMETEIRLETKKNAETEAIKVFADNLRELLLSPPLGQKRILALDPGIRTGCKIACLDGQGKLLQTDTVYLSKSDAARTSAGERLLHLVETYEVEAIAVGNGTAARETESFVKGIGLPGDIPVIMVSESGASVYSASAVAREEFPDLDVSLRGAISIGRRLLDPLAELVKIDPKSIGVGQYQHDVNQLALKERLDDVVMSCVNAVGVEVNTASEQLLTYVSGLGPQLARNIVAYRNDSGPLPSRKALKDVPRLGPKAFEQAAGFLRIQDGENVLDRSAVHPEVYPIVESMASDQGCSLFDLMKDENLRKQIDLSRYVTDHVGMPTLTDILSELAKPGRDPREQFESMAFMEGLERLEDLEPGLRVPGVITNVTAFGAFVDIGVHQDGLIHISQLADHFVKDPHQIVKVHQKVQVTVLGVDLERRRISLSMKEKSKQPPKRPLSPPKAKSKRGSGKQKKDGSLPFNNPFAKVFKP
jgi:uncharacterized protein